MPKGFLTRRVTNAAAATTPSLRVSGRFRNLSRGDRRFTKRESVHRLSEHADNRATTPTRMTIGRAPGVVTLNAPCTSDDLLAGRQSLHRNGAGHSVRQRNLLCCSYLQRCRSRSPLEQEPGTRTTGTPFEFHIRNLATGTQVLNSCARSPGVGRHARSLHQPRWSAPTCRRARRCRRARISARPP